MTEYLCLHDCILLKLLTERESELEQKKTLEPQLVSSINAYIAKRELFITAITAIRYTHCMY